MGLALHEMYEVSGLVIGDATYEEYVPSTGELHLLRKRRRSLMMDNTSHTTTSEYVWKLNPGTRSLNQGMTIGILV